jgi:hypothetical protein
MTELGDCRNGVVVTAKNIDGYSFVAWVQIVSIGDTLSVYVDNVTKQTSHIWVIGGATINCHGYALYIKS